MDPSIGRVQGAGAGAGIEGGQAVLGARAVSRERVVARCEMGVVFLSLLLDYQAPSQLAADDIDEWDPEETTGYGQPVMVLEIPDILNSEDDEKIDQWLS